MPAEFDGLIINLTAGMIYMRTLAATVDIF